MRNTGVLHNTKKKTKRAINNKNVSVKTNSFSIITYRHHAGSSLSSSSHRPPRFSRHSSAYPPRFSLLSELPRKFLASSSLNWMSPERKFKVFDKDNYVAISLDGSFPGYLIKLIIRTRAQMLQPHSLLSSLEPESTVLGVPRRFIIIKARSKVTWMKRIADILYNDCPELTIIFTVVFLETGRNS